MLNNHTKGAREGRTRTTGRVSYLWLRESGTRSGSVQLARDGGIGDKTGEYVDGEVSADNIELSGIEGGFPSWDEREGAGCGVGLLLFDPTMRSVQLGREGGGKGVWCGDAGIGAGVGAFPPKVQLRKSVVLPVCLPGEES